MPRNRQYWNVLEEYIRSNPHDLLGMRTVVGANQIRRLVILIARHVRIHKNKDLAIAYVYKKLKDLHDKGFPEIMGSAALSGLFKLLDPIWSYGYVEKFGPEEIYEYRNKHEND